jgi:hypothetical protein
MFVCFGCARDAKPRNVASDHTRLLVDADSIVLLTRSSEVKVCEADCSAEIPRFADFLGSETIVGYADRVVIFDSSAARGRTIGRSGAGPGEFTGAFDGEMTPSGLTVFDIFLMRITRFDGRGKPTLTTAISKPPQFIRDAFVHEDGVVFVTLSKDSGAYLLKMRDGEAFDTISRIPTNPIPMNHAGFTIPPFFSPLPLIYVSDSLQTVHATHGDFKITKLDSLGGAVFTIEYVDQQHRQVTSGMLTREYDREYKRHLGHRIVPGLMQNLEDAYHNARTELPAFDRLVVLKDESIWARRYVYAEDTVARWDIFTSSGDAYGSVRLAPSVRVMAGTTSRTLINEPDTMDVPHLKWVKFTRTPVALRKED